jgi:putative DNA methylase
MCNVRRLIEVDLPIRAISEHARKDQNIRKGHLHTIHVWWATRPLASCRAVIMATLLPDPADPNCPTDFVRQARDLMRQWACQHASKAGSQGFSRVVKIRKDLSILDDPVELRGALLDFIADFAAWDAGVDPVYLRTARSLVAAAHPDGPPLVLDPFAGAGSIPFEALRVGAQAFAGDLNPVAVLINKVALEYLPKYGRRLAQGVEKWGKWVLEEARKRLAPYYPADSKGNIPLAYIWARTITCEGPGCGAEVPLLGMLWLSRKSKNRVALRYHGDKKTKQVHIEVFKPKSEGDLPPPISKRFAATCPCCGFTTPYKRVREQLRARRGGAHNSRLLAVIMLSASGSRSFRSPDEHDVKIAEKAAKEMKSVQAATRRSSDPLPDEPYPDWYSGVFNPGLWNVKTWGDLFTPRQALTMASFVQTVRDARERIVKESGDKGYADAVTTCLALAVSNMSHYLSSVSIYALDHMISAFVQGSGMAMRPDFAEANPLMPKLVGGFDYALGQVVAVLEREVGSAAQGGTVQAASATRIPLPDDSLAYLITDPPYYAAVPYSDLSDFCYVWLKRMLRDVHPDLTRTELTPKDDELVAYYVQPTERPKKDATFFEKKMQEALADARRTLKPDGVGVVIFAHKGTAGWEALLNALVNAGWTVTASWPIDTERAARMRAKNSAVLASSVHLVCRPRENPDGSLRTAEVGDWRELLAELPKRIHEWMPRLAEEGVVGADAIFACLGPALEVFSRYDRVEKASGEQVSLREYLEHVWAAVSQEALRMVFEGADASGFEEDARLTAMWLWTLQTNSEGGRQQAEGADEEEEAEEDETGGRKKKPNGGYALEFDAARKIAQGLGAHLENLTSVVEVKGDTARLLAVSERTAHLFGRARGDAPAAERREKTKQMKLSFAEEVEGAEAEAGWGEKGAPKVGQTTLDRVHQAMILFAAGRSEALRRFLVEEGVGRDAKFWTLAQALSALYPAGSAEKRWVDGVLARKKGLGL